MLISQIEGYLKNAWYRFLEETMLFLLALEWSLKEIIFSYVKTKTNSNFAVSLAEMPKKEIIDFFLFDESHFWNMYCLICAYGMYRNWLIG